MSRSTFGAMGCEVVVAGAAPDELAAIGAVFAERDRVFSRFRSDSELSRVNAARGPVPVSTLFRRTLETALSAASTTGGLVDPTLGAAIEAAGYDRDFELLDPTAAATRPPVRGRWRSVFLLGNVLVRPAGMQLDLNGVVKALAVDDAVELLSGPGYVSAGGDLATRGRVDVALPADGAVSLVAGGLATSGTSRRRWVRAGEEQHHLIDPRTGRPSASPWSEVTVAGASCLAADVAAKAAFLLGDDGPAWLERRGMPGRFVRRDGTVDETEGWRAATRRDAACT